MLMCQKNKEKLDHIYNYLVENADDITMSYIFTCLAATLNSGKELQDKVKNKKIHK